MTHRQQALDTPALWSRAAAILMSLAAVLAPAAVFAQDAADGQPAETAPAADDSAKTDTATTDADKKDVDDFDFKGFVEKMSPKIVTVKFILKVSMGQMDDEEQETEVNGVMIDPKGIVICSNIQMGGFMALMQSMMGGGGPQMSSTPTDLKVLVGDDVEGVEAELLTRDTDNDLAWIRIKEPGDKKFDYVDLTKSGSPDVGDPLLSVSRMGKRFDRLPIFNAGRLAGIASKPRKLYIPLGGVNGFGLPVFTKDGDLVGVSAFLPPDPDDSGAGAMGMMSMFSSMNEMSSTIIPAAEVHKATRRAVEDYGAEAESGSDSNSSNSNP